jgi:uncharacterized protein
VTSSPNVSTQAVSKPVFRAVASPWHTVIVLFAVLGLSALGARSGSLPGAGAYGRVGSYLLIMIFEWVTVAFIWYGVRGRGISISELVGGRWARPADFFRDLGIGIAFLLVCGIGVVNGLGYLLKVVDNQAIRQMMPRTNTEVILWCLMSLTAGFCEEVIFRGYLQRQFTAITQATMGGIILQGIVFGAGHGYQGWKFMLIIAVYGTTFGLLALWRRSLRPGMVAHLVQDTMGGLVARYLMH